VNFCHVLVTSMMYRELTGLKKPVLDKSNILHWPLFFFCMQRLSPVSDFIQDFCEIDMFSVHLDMISFYITCCILLSLN
jgi:hypothetical protein